MTETDVSIIETGKPLRISNQHEHKDVVDAVRENKNMIVVNIRIAEKNTRKRLQQEE